MDKSDAIKGCLLGTAVGDSIGLPREGVSARRAQALFGPELRQGFFLGRGMLSDDTEQSCLVVQAYLRADGDPDRFGRSLAWRLRWWLAALPAGVGLGTARAIFKLWLGVPWQRSGSNSAGNGAAMRVACLGLLCTHKELGAFVDVATRVTHRDPRARRAAMLVALAARYGAEQGPDAVAGADYLALARDRLRGDIDEELEALLAQMEVALERGDAVQRYAQDIGASHGVSGYAYRTVPIAIYAWLRNAGSLRATLGQVIALGGDTDTVGAIAGALVGATLGNGRMQDPWIEQICDYPRSVEWIRRLADRAAEGGKPLPLCWPLIVPRNLLFLGVVLAHCCRRLLPPYR